MILVLQGRNSARAKTLSSLTRSSCQLGNVPQMKIIISCRTGQTLLHSGSMKQPSLKNKKQSHVQHTHTHSYPYCKLPPVCLPSSLVLSICLYLCLTLFSLSTIITHYSMSSLKNNPPFLLAPCLPPYSFLCFPSFFLFPAFTEVINC